MASENCYTWSSEVRDYELDLQGIVNNANYFHYYEHARHLYLISLGISIQELHDAGYNLVLVKTEVTYHQSLRSKDQFAVDTTISQISRLKLACNQMIRRLPDNNIISKSEHIITSVCISSNKPEIPDFLNSKLQKALT